MESYLIRTSFDQILAMLQLKKKKEITFILEQLNKDSLRKRFDDSKSTLIVPLCEFNLVQILISSIQKLSSIISGSDKMDIKTLKKESCVRVLIATYILMLKPVLFLISRIFQ